MPTAAEWAQIRADVMALRDGNAVSLTLRRGATTLTAQTVRVEKSTSQSQRTESQGAESATGRIVVLGDTTLDIQAEDRFTLSGQLYVVTFVHPNRKACTLADAVVEE